MTAGVGALTQLKHRLFPNQVTTLLLRKLDDCDNYFRDELMWPAVKDGVRPRLYRSTSKRDALVTDDIKAGRMVMMLVADYCERQVCSGMMHVYRGVLGFDGKSVRNIAEEAIRYLNDYEYLDYDDYRERLDRIEEFVKGAG